MEETIIDRLIRARTKMGLKQGKFAEKIGLSQAAVSDFENHKKALIDRNIRVICLVFGINEGWLRTGKGEMFLDGKAPDEDTMLEMYRALSDDGRKMVMDYINLVLKNEKAMRGEINPDGEAAGIGPGDNGKTG